MKPKAANWQWEVCRLAAEEGKEKDTTKALSPPKATGSAEE